MSESTKTLLEELREKRTALLDEIAPAIEQREKERDEFAQREKDLAAQATRTIEAVTRDQGKTQEERQAAVTEADKPLVEARAAFKAAEEGFEADFARRESEIKALEQRISEQEVLQYRRELAAKASQGSPSVSIVNEEKIYRRQEGSDRGVSYFRDLAAVSPNIQSLGLMADGSGAADRLRRHAEEMDVEMPKRAEERERRARSQADAAEREFRSSFAPGMVRRGGLEASPFERRVNPNRTDGQGGYFVPPLWLIDEYLPYLRAGRPTANLCRQMDLPPGTDSINVPRIKSPTQVLPQQADAAAVASKDYTDEAVQANVKTLAGQEDVAIQLIEQSPGQIVDRVIMEDLLADYNRLVDRQVLYSPSGSTTSLNAGEIMGLFPKTNWGVGAPYECLETNIEGTNGEIPAIAFNGLLGALASKVSYNRFDLTQLHFVMHPRRWFWFATIGDGEKGKLGRPLVNAADFPNYNNAALEANPAPFEGLVGRVPFGPNVYIDGNIPTTVRELGVYSTTGSEDYVMAAKFDDLWLFEGDLRTRVLPEVLSGTLEIRYQVFNYVAFLLRYPQSVAFGTGKGGSSMIAPENGYKSVY